MKKTLIISIFLPYISLCQDIKQFSQCDLIINQILENTASYINQKNTPNIEFKFIINTKIFNNNLFYSSISIHDIFFYRLWFFRF